MLDKNKVRQSVTKWQVSHPGHKHIEEEEQESSGV